MKPLFKQRHFNRIAVMAACALSLSALGPAAAEETLMPTQTESFYSFTMKTIDGADKKLEDYRGKALLVVNTASKCGFTPQYKGLEALYEQYKSRGFEILAFPANNFLGQEPGSNEEIKKFCELKFKTTFPLFSKISVKGKDMHPLYQYLTTRPGMEGDVAWNFNKFLISPEGQVAARFDSKTEPLSDKLTSKLESVLPA